MLEWARRLALFGVLATALVVPSGATAGFGDGYFYEKGLKSIPDGRGKAVLKIESLLPGDIDPTIQYASLSLRVDHPRTRDLVVSLKRPNFQFMGSPQAGIPRVVTLSDRDTSGRNLGRRGCPDTNPMSAPNRFTTLNDAGGPPNPMIPTAPPALSTGTAPYAGTFAPAEPLGGFNGYHAPPGPTDPDPETWKLIVRDVRDGKVGSLRCAVLYLYRT
jgi:hypothetical protein